MSVCAHECVCALVCVCECARVCVESRVFQSDLVCSTAPPPAYKPRWWESGRRGPVGFAGVACLRVPCESCVPTLNAAWVVGGKGTQPGATCCLEPALLTRKSSSPSRLPLGGPGQSGCCVRGGAPPRRPVSVGRGSSRAERSRLPSLHCFELALAF